MSVLVCSKGCGTSLAVCMSHISACNQNRDRVINAQCACMNCEGLVYVTLGTKRFGR